MILQPATIQGSSGILDSWNLLRGSGYWGYVDSNQGYNLYFRGLYVPKS